MKSNQKITLYTIKSQNSWFVMVYSFSFSVVCPLHRNPTDELLRWHHAYFQGIYICIYIYRDVTLWFMDVLRAIRIIRPYHPKSQPKRIDPPSHMRRHGLTCDLLQHLSLKNGICRAVVSELVSSEWELRSHFRVVIWRQSDFMNVYLCRISHI